ncbi:hypothetical protein GUITHDRAFT_154860 [Guillardia theta CCMP2712]|uniref:protein-serine/threonine phosphatase n=1 Tax=Guillardia theta (strain CCMP2712) TaxID=905079 RepID=L1IPR2_GUITC|nr:hypothetical protein GUITHDRAFT_154860 [Guillardia theta CCMP2712]EKX37869.1 hypothetical protein GUITHDRAFT_154860 [Guillardia theta CCMP2712]|mmetsp:Transcript_4796/g.17448  ORF Transcript_4796/g.17448 Transcript_4796/m.17448 type:complete len:314 (-) Transcript_4796:140-1081(-)|eukprot:XP_005824849.1 hypothetical protein GUITHDRAFT_154860 [Guillardia theta CCMP2712]
MGVLLSKPNTDKVFDDGESEKIAYAACSMQGWRTTMEDAHAAELDIDGKKSAFFGVYDGHAGTDVAIYSSRFLHKNLLKSPLLKQGQIEAALKEAFLKTDSDLLTSEGMSECEAIRREIARRDEDEDEEDEDGSIHVTDSGSTAVTCLILDRVIYCANAGDSRAVLCRNGTAVDLSEDHKPTNAVERTRIENANGFVEDKRVNGTLAVARAMGDFSFKADKQLPPEEQQVTCNPEIKKFPMQEGDEFIIMACDGIWDVVSSQQCVDLIREKLNGGKSLRETLSDLFDHCLSPHPSANEGLGCDNMTAIIVKFK